jgi:non-specific serine/threonine protein kinase
MRMLLLLDNCEHLVDACVTLVAVLLAAAPSLNVLVTSQIPLGVLGEVCWRVPSLSLPEEQRTYDHSELATFEAVQLFVERAQSQRPAFALTLQNAGTIVRICRQLDGIPLALELAAVRLASLPLETLEARLVDRFRLLTGGSRSSLPRQQTLQATLDWSYGLLSAPEQHMLHRLSVFAGGWDLAAAEAVVGGGSMDDYELLDVLDGLVTKSLAQLDTSGVPRFRLLETVRHFARLHLEASGEAPMVSDRHLQWYVELAEALRETLRGPGQAVASAQLELERDNTSAALLWARQRGAQSMGLRLAIALRRHWEMRGRLSEGREWLDTLLALDAPEAEGAELALIAQALNACGLLAFGQGDYRRATALHEQSLALERGLGNLEATAATLNNLGNIAVRTGDYAQASALYQEALTLFQVLENEGAIATVLNNLGSIAVDQGDHALAAQFYDQSLALRRRLNDVSGTSESLANLGHLAFSRGDHTSAESLLDESLSLRRVIGDAGAVSESLRMLAQVALTRGDRLRAADLYRESLELCRKADDVWGSAACLQGFAEVSASQERYEDAAVFCSIADTLRHRIGAALASADREAYQRITTLARNALGDVAFAAAGAHASVLTVEAAMARAFDSPAPQ